MRKFLLLILFIQLILVCPTQAQINFGYGSSFQYIKGSAAATISKDWISSEFNSQEWNEGKAPFRFGSGTGTGGTLLTDMQNRYSTLGLRSSFQVEKLPYISDVTFTVKYDDAFILWINGKQAIVRNVHPQANFNTVAFSEHGALMPEEIVISVKDLNLKEGQNTLAVQVFNVSLTNSDLYFDVNITAKPSIDNLADSLCVNGLNHRAGFYESPFDLTITAPEPNMTIWYTIDCSNPETSSTVINAEKQVTLKVDPAASGRPQTPSFIVRVALQKEGFPLSKSVTQTYIFIQSVIKQKNPGGGWPSSNVNGQILDFEMDPDVTNDSRYASLMDDALLAIPSISIVSDLPNLFNSQTGIYVNALNHGDVWERFSSAELIRPDGQTGFSINAGLRIRGGWSRHADYPKHAFRLFFRKEYGAGKLKYPLFDEEGVDEFDKIDLRTAQNYAWSNGDSRNTMVRDVFARDSQRELGEPYTRSRYYHLYLNGMYWGIYQTQERSEANFAADYLGGKSDDYDVVKVNGDYSYQIEATDGSLTGWQKVWNMCTQGFASNANYFALEGKDQNGNPQKNKEILVDIDNLIDYMMVVFYTGSFDAPISAFNQNQKPNNFYAINNRNDRSSGFTFYAHDMEHAMMVDAVSPGIGINENRVQPPGMSVTQFQYFHPQWLHDRLTKNAEYRQRFIDRAEKQFYNNGVFTPQTTLARFNSRVKEIEMAIIAESARWGDAKSWAPYTKDGHWLPEVEKTRSRFFPVRTDIVIKQMQNVKICSNLRAPQMITDGIISTVEDIEFDELVTLQLKNGNSTGKIYATLDGSDPRLIGGGVSSKANEVASGQSFSFNETTIVNARILNGSDWSGLRTVRIKRKQERFEGLKMTELHYHPLDSINGLDTINDKSYEFIEFKNTAKHAIALKGLRLDTGITYQFRDTDVLPSNQFYVVSAGKRRFYERYGRLSSGSYGRNLSNSGEKVNLKTATGVVVLSVPYTDQSPWPAVADGKGWTLVSVERNPTGDPSVANYWRPSANVHGSPFADDPNYVDAVEVLSLNESIFKAYPNPNRGVLHLHFDEQLGNLQLEFFSISGTRYFSTVIDQGDSMLSLEALGLKQGVYLLKGKQGTKQYWVKLIYSGN